MYKKKKKAQQSEAREIELEELTDVIFGGRNQRSHLLARKKMGKGKISREKNGEGGGTLQEWVLATERALKFFWI